MLFLFLIVHNVHPSLVFRLHPFPYHAQYNIQEWTPDCPYRICSLQGQRFEWAYFTQINGLQQQDTERSPQDESALSTDFKKTKPTWRNPPVNNSATPSYLPKPAENKPVLRTTRKSAQIRNLIARALERDSSHLPAGHVSVGQSLCTLQ